MNAWPILVSLTIKSTAVLVAAAMASLALARRSAAARHLVWTGAFAVLLALPVLTLALPSWPQRFANAVLPGTTFTVEATASGGAAGMVRGAAAPRAAAAAAAGRPAFDFRRAILLLWAAGALAAFLHMLAAYFALARLRGRALPAPCRGGEFGIPEDVEMLEADHAMPMTAGVLRPAIFLPSDARSWSAARLRMVVLHEYAHVRRGDAAAQFLARAALCLFWFHPLAWFGWREAIKERERAADDLVLHAGAEATDYAEHLLEIARGMRAVPAAGAAGIAMARPSQLEERLRAILDARVRRAGHGRAALAASLLAALALATPLATVRAQSQSEQAAPPDVPSVIFRANAQKNHEILDHAAVTYESLRKFDEARKLREAALALRKQEGTASYAEGLVQLGDLAARARNGKEALEYYRQAAALGDMPETVPALIALGIDAAFGESRDSQAAAGYLDRARNAARGGNQMGRAMTWLAVIKQDDPAQAAEAESLYRAARSLEEPGSSEQAVTTDLLARLLRRQNRDAEAGLMEQESVAMHRALVARLSAPVLPSVEGPRKVGGGVTAPRLLHKVEPSYSDAARAEKYQGTVLLKVVIDVDGRAKDVQVVRSLGLGLDEKAVEAVNSWVFSPGSVNGLAVPVQAQIEINFRLL